MNDPIVFWTLLSTLLGLGITLMVLWFRELRTAYRMAADLERADALLAAIARRRA